MSQTIAKEEVALKRLTINQLRQRYAELYNEPTTAHHRSWLIKKILWRLQANVTGDISERARKRALEIANDSDLRVSGPKATTAIKSITSVFHNRIDRRLPLPGSTIKREYKGETLEVLVLEEGFEYDGEKFKSLSAVAAKITGSHCNGFLFFGLNKKVVAK